MYDVDASGQAEGCVRATPVSQLGKCFSLKGGETVVLQTCYSQLPGHGVRMQFGGGPRWGKKADELGIPNTSLQNYGFTTTSDMQGASDENPVMPFLTPIR